MLFFLVIYIEGTLRLGYNQHEDKVQNRSAECGKQGQQQVNDTNNCCIHINIVCYGCTYSSQHASGTRTLHLLWF